MPDDLPIYSESPLRTGLQFADLDRLKGPDTARAWQKADESLSGLEGAANLPEARKALRAISRDQLVKLHGQLFSHLSGAGMLRTSAVVAQYRGQDCAPP